MTSSRGEADSEPDPEKDEKDLIDEQFHALVSGLSLDQSAPSTYLDELNAAVDPEGFTPPQPQKTSIKNFFSSGRKAFKRWKDNPRPDNSGLDDDGAQI